MRGNRHAQALLDSSEYGLVHRLRVARGVDQYAAARVVGGDLAEPLAKFFVKIAVEAFEPVGGRARGSAGKTDIDRQIEDHGQVRREIAEGETVQYSEVLERHPSAVALIGRGGIREAVGHQPYPLRESRGDDAGNVITACGDEQQGFADRIPALAFAFEQQPPDRLGTGRSSRLAAGLRRDPRATERRHQQSDLRRFAGAFAALD